MNAPLILWILALGTHCSAHFVGLPHLTQLIKIISFFGESSMNWVCQIREAYEIWRVVGVQDQSWNWFKQTVIFRTQNTFQQFNKALAMQLYSEWLQVIFFYKKSWLLFIFIHLFIYWLPSSPVCSGCWIPSSPSPLSRLLTPCPPCFLLFLFIHPAPLWIFYLSASPKRILLENQLYVKEQKCLFQAD